MIEKIVDMESKLFKIKLPAYGSLYHVSFLKAQGVADIPLALDSQSKNWGSGFCIGPSSE